METPTTLSVQPHIHTAEASQLPDRRHILEIAQKEYQWKSQFAQLPRKVLLIIIDHTDTAERISLLATCSYLRQLSEPLLYRHLTPNWKSRIQLLKTLGERQDLLLHIHSFRGPLIPTSDTLPSGQQFTACDPSSYRRLENEWFPVSAPLLLRATNIRDLEFTDLIDWRANDRWKLFSTGVSNMKLRSLAFASPANGPLDLTPILRGQPELTRLELNCPTAHFNGLQEADVPKLKAFKGTWRQAAAIVPGRPVGHLNLHCDYVDLVQNLEEQIYQKLHQSSATVHTLIAYGVKAFDYTTLSHMLQLVIQYLPKIMDFTIYGMSPNFSIQALLEGIPKLSMINSLVIHESHLKFNESTLGASSAGSGHLEINSWEQVSERLKKHCPSLSRCEYHV